MVTVTLLDSDRAWFKSSQGVEGTEDRREVSFCQHAILNPETTMVVEDATLDARFADNPRVPAIPTSASTPATRSPPPAASRWGRSA
jgi:hypothetical protein